MGSFLLGDIFEQEGEPVIIGFLNFIQKIKLVMNIQIKFIVG